MCHLAIPCKEILRVMRAGNSCAGGTHPVGVVSGTSVLPGETQQALRGPDAECPRRHLSRDAPAGIPAFPDTAGHEPAHCCVSLRPENLRERGCATGGRPLTCPPGGPLFVKRVFVVEIGRRRSDRLPTLVWVGGSTHLISARGGVRDFLPLETLRIPPDRVELLGSTAFSPATPAFSPVPAAT